MRSGRALLFAVLVYVGLDLCLPEMPGAFDFEPTGSIESAQAARGRATLTVTVLTAPAKDPFVIGEVPQRDFRYRQVPGARVSLHRRAPVNRLPRATAASPSSPEDPH